MKEVIKSKWMMGFLVFMVGFLYLNAKDVKKLETMKAAESQPYIVINV